MKAEDKLKEASRWLSKIKELPDSVNKREELGDILDAFLQAWRGVFDVLLYDYAEKYSMISPARTEFFNKRCFEKKAKELEKQGNPEPRSFIKWFKEKEETLRKEERKIWNLRIQYFHRGGETLKPTSKPKYRLKKPIPYEPSIISKEPPYAIYLGKNIQVETTEESAIAGMPQTVIRWKCEKALDLMKKIVKEARERFK